MVLSFVVLVNSQNLRHACTSSSLLYASTASGERNASCEVPTSSQDLLWGRQSRSSLVLRNRSMQSA